jgi:hypothetical protein
MPFPSVALNVIEELGALVKGGGEDNIVNTGLATSANQV